MDNLFESIMLLIYTCVSGKREWPSGYFQYHRIGSAFGDLRNLPKLLWGIVALWIPKASRAPREENL